MLMFFFGSLRKKESNFNMRCPSRTIDAFALICSFAAFLGLYELYIICWCILGAPSFEKKMHPHCRYSNQTASNSQFFCMCSLVLDKGTEKKHTCKLIQIDSECKKCANLANCGTVCHESSKYCSFQQKKHLRVAHEFPSFFHQKLMRTPVCKSHGPCEYRSSTNQHGPVLIKKESNPLICPLKKKIQDEQAALVTFHTFS